MKKCFFVCPIGNETSPQRKRSDTVLKHILEPVCQELGFEVVRVDKMNTVDRIDNTIIEQIRNSELVIADITDHNPNAFYELGFRHSLGKPLIPIMEENTEIPFDLHNLRMITYVTNDFDKADTTKERLKETIQSFNIKEETDTHEKTPTASKPESMNVVPYLLNIQDSISELRSLVIERNKEMNAQTIELAMEHIKKNSQGPEMQLFEMFFSKALENPKQIENFMGFIDKYSSK